MKYAKIIDGVVDAIAIERPGHFETETYTETVTKQVPRQVETVVPMLDEKGEPVFGPDEETPLTRVEMETVYDDVTEDVERQRQVFVPDLTYEEVADDVFGGHIRVDGKVIAPEPPAFTSDDVNSERDRRVLNGFMFAGKLFDYNMEAKTNISGAAQMAFMAMIANPAAAKSLRWNGGADDFQWRTYDNSFLPMTGEMVIAFGQTAAAHEYAHKKATWALKDMPEIPKDFKDDKYWPTLETRL